MFRPYRPLAGALLAAATLTAPVLADGSEQLGPPVGLDLAPGTDILLAGVGLHDSQPGTIELAVPAGVTVVQVIAYWEGAAATDDEQGATDTIRVGGHNVVGKRIGGPTNFWEDWRTTTYRADVTDLGLITNGNNQVAVQDLDFSYANSGAGLAVVVDDGSGGVELGVRDGNDYSYLGFPPPFKETELVTYELEPSIEPRQARLGFMVAGVGDARPTAISIMVDGQWVENLIDVLGSHDGPEWDTLVHDFTVPAGATSLAVGVYSWDEGTGPYAGNQPASLTWVFTSLALETSDGPSLEGCTTHFWRCNLKLWDRYKNDVTTVIQHQDRFNDIMGLHPWYTGALWCIDLRQVLDGWSGWFWLHRMLNRQAVAALANADSGIDYPYTVSQVIAMYRDAVGADKGPENICSALKKLAAANYRYCPL